MGGLQGHIHTTHFTHTFLPLLLTALNIKSHLWIALTTLSTSEEGHSQGQLLDHCNATDQPLPRLKPFPSFTPDSKPSSIRQ